MRRFAAALPYALTGVVAFIVTFLFVVAVGHAQDSAVVVHDKTGILGPVLDNFWPVIVTFLTSLAVKIVAEANKGFARASEPVKWAALYFFALLFNTLARFLGISELDPSAPMLGLGLVQTVAAALVYKFGQHRVPTVADTSAYPPPPIR